MRLKPAKPGAMTVARKWSPPPVRSWTCALAPGIAVSMRCRSSSVEGIEDSVAVATLREALDSVSNGSDYLITFTDKGAEKVQEFLDSQSADIQTSGLRVGVRGGGCSGFQYALAFDSQRDGDQVFEDHGLRILVDNPNVIAACGCGSSFRVAEEEEVSAV